ncbi:tRNA dihydrouridine(20/20a) synthase DusA [Clostridium sp. MSJ-4]|uniref:tRNA-dihydrouridine(20/20a) synthase n=1 Tax=Clostridium simiarum TaxID=2841506 RepID=A0ABS6EZ57_9CLOT|nr:tRNA dihydrouridine(20/20a) synthase DusA [Clostridium simiarum]MBU5591522.1 tRNA dihydrouridine(20/20a) synthase DusA [Clostridium simiarum]
MEKYISNVVSPKVSIAPMVDRTDRHFRYFARILTKKPLLYTEMISCQGIINGNRKQLLDFNTIEKPLSLQIAGSSPEEIYEAVKIADNWDYDEINLNAGCPSDRVSGNLMGATLMAYPKLVKEMVDAMASATKKPITVKHRIGIDGKNILPQCFNRTLLDRYEDMVNFISIVEKSRVHRFIIHARIAILEGLSPKENREIPPLRYEEVYRLKKEFSHLNIEINGGIKTLEEINHHLKFVNGTMIGRAAYNNSFILRELDSLYNKGEINNISRKEVIEEFIPYIESLENLGGNSFYAIKHMIGLFEGKPGSKRWRQILGTPASKNIKASELLKIALKELPLEI